MSTAARGFFEVPASLTFHFDVRQRRLACATEPQSHTYERDLHTPGLRDSGQAPRRGLQTAKRCRLRIQVPGMLMPKNPS